MGYGNGIAPTVLTAFLDGQTTTARAPVVRTTPLHLLWVLGVGTFLPSTSDHHRCAFAAAVELVPVPRGASGRDGTGAGKTGLALLWTLLTVFCFNAAE